MFEYEPIRAMVCGLICLLVSGLFWVPLVVKVMNWRKQQKSRYGLAEGWDVQKLRADG